MQRRTLRSPKALYKLLTSPAYHRLWIHDVSHSLPQVVDIRLFFAPTCRYAISIQSQAMLWIRACHSPLISREYTISFFAYCHDDKNATIYTPSRKDSGKRNNSAVCNCTLRPIFSLLHLTLFFLCFHRRGFISYRTYWNINICEWEIPSSCKYLFKYKVRFKKKRYYFSTNFFFATFSLQ